MIAELRHQLNADLLEPSGSKRYKTSKKYFDGDYYIAHHGTWRLVYKKTFVMSESDANFWDIVNSFDLLPWEHKEFVDIDDTIEYQEEHYWNTEDLDSNFTPSFGRDWESPNASGHKSLRRLLGFVA